MKRLALLIIGISFFPAPASAAEVREIVSDGGITAWLIEEHSLPLIAVRVAFEGAGTAQDGENREGRAYMTAKGLSEGAGGMSAREFAAALESRAIVFQASADEDLLDVSVQMMKNTRDEAFHYLGQALSDPRFDSEAVDRVRRDMLSRLKAEAQDPNGIAERHWRKQAFGDHPYAHTALGTEDSVRRLDRYDLQAFTERHLTRENLLVAVVGDITPEELKPLLDKTFGGLPEKYKPSVEVPEIVIPPQAKPMVVDYDIPQTVVRFGAQGLKRDDPEFMAAYVMNQILGGNTLTARLGYEIRERRGLAYGVRSTLRPLMRAAVLSGSFATRNEEAGQALAVLRDALDTFSKNGPTAQELRDAKQYIIGSLAINLDSNDGLASFLITMQHQRLGRDYLEKRARLVEAVRQSDVKAAAKRLIDAEGLVMVMVGKPTFAP